MSSYSSGPAQQAEMTPEVEVRVPVFVPESRRAVSAGSERTYLAVPFAEKDDAKQLGARWDRAERAWFVPAGADLDAFAAWMPAKGSVHIAVDVTPAEQFAEALRECGLRPDGVIEMDGQMHRVPVEGDRGKERSGAYTGHADGRPAGFIQNFRTGAKVNWKSIGQAQALDARERATLAAEVAQKRQDRAAERERMYERTAQQVDAIWAAAVPVQSHPYLDDKGVPSHGLRQGEDGRLLVPVRDADGKLWSLQHVGADGSKRFHEGGRVDGGHFIIGDVSQPGPLLIAEGYATAATVHKLTGQPVIVAFNAGNLLAVAQAYRAMHPDRPIYIAGDNDHQRQAEGKPNVGREKAEQAAAAIGGQALFPGFPAGAKGTDWNDLARDQGQEAARLWLRAAFAFAAREQAAPGHAATLDKAPTQAPAIARDRARTPDMDLER